MSGCQNFATVDYGQNSNLSGIHTGQYLESSFNPSDVLSIDGNILNIGDTILLLNQSNKIENGYYKLVSQGNNINKKWILERVPPGLCLFNNMTFLIKNGNTLSTTMWVLESNDIPITPGGSILNFSEKLFNVPPKFDQIKDIDTLGFRDLPNVDWTYNVNDNTYTIGKSSVYNTLLQLDGTFDSSIIINNELENSSSGQQLISLNELNNGDIVKFNFDLDDFSEITNIASPDGGNQEFGSSVSISNNGELVLVGAPNSSINLLSEGAVYVWKLNNDGNYIFASTILANTTITNERFGSSLSLSSNGRIAIIGAPSNGSLSGSVYIFESNNDFTSWTQIAKLNASDGNIGNLFGKSVDISNDGSVAIIGAPNDNENGNNAGGAYIFIESNSIWSELTKLIGNDTIANDEFGTSVEIIENLGAIVGSPFNNSGVGSVYIYTESSNIWSELQKLTPSGGFNFSNANFGTSVTANNDGNIIIGGAPGFSDSSSNGGCVIIFINNSNVWSQNNLLEPFPSVSTNGLFGTSVSISGDNKFLMVGSPRTGNSGRVYLFESNDGGSSWDNRQIITSSNPISDDMFGISVDISSGGKYSVIGSPGTPINSTDSGEAILYLQILPISLKVIQY
jgi:hypothetical protein